MTKSVKFEPRANLFCFVMPFRTGFASHSQPQTPMKHYTTTDANMIQKINERMNNYNSQKSPLKHCY
jgi:hypothetical protein